MQEFDSSYIRIDREASARRIAADIDQLGEPAFTRQSSPICRYSYTPEYENTVQWVAERLEELGFTTSRDAFGSLVARNRPEGEEVFGLGSHCDSNRNGGRYDGTLGVLMALELCRTSAELGLDLPLQIVVPFEEEASGFGIAMLGSRIIGQAITEEELRSLRSLDDQEPLWSHAERAGFDPDSWRDSRRVLDSVVGWVEAHIEQGRVLQDASEQIGVIEAIVGIVHADIILTGRADHAGATPMPLRADAGVVAAHLVVALTELAQESPSAVVATVGELDWEPGLINVVPERARLGIDVRGPIAADIDHVIQSALSIAQAKADSAGVTLTYAERNRVVPTTMDAGVVSALERAAAASGAPYRRMTSGACHDTMHFAPHVPSAMVFVPCLDGISHSPAEHAESGDAALGTEIMLNALVGLARDRTIPTTHNDRGSA